MVDFAYPLFPVFAGLGFILPLIPLTWHLQVWNSGTCFYIFWSSLACLNQLINSVIWHGTAMNVAPIWCDISSRITMAVAVAIPTASLCINRRLYQIARIQGALFTREEKIRSVLIDSALCIGIPLIQLVAYYCVQGHRFDIYEDIGCYPAVVNTIPSIFAFEIWPIIIGMVSGTYCALSLMSLLKRQAQFSQFMSSNKAISMSRYVRLMALATTDIFFTVPIATFALGLNLVRGVDSYTNWDDVHFDFGRIGQIPAVYWRTDRWLVLSLQLTRWSCVLCALVFFAFFGFAEEARRHYKNAFFRVLSPFAGPWGILTRYVFPKHKSLISTSQATLSVAVTTSTCKFDHDKDIEKGLSVSKSQDSCDEVPFTPSSEPLPLYESHPSYARAL